jgi:chromosome segregation ATPase
MAWPSLIGRFKHLTLDLHPHTMWVFFAGATMIVLGICLLAAERELRKQRREIDVLRRNQQPSEPQGEKHQSAELLMTRNKELAEKISSLSSELKESKRMMEDLQSERHRWVSDLELKQQLQASQEIIKELEAEQRLAGVNLENQQLRDEIANLQNQLQASEIRLSESVRQNREAAEHYAQLQNEIVELKQQAAKGQATAREPEAVQEQLDAVESREMILKAHQHKLEAQIENLQRALFMEKKAVQELDATCERLAGMERVCQQLREENRRLEDDISRLQLRPAPGNSGGGSEFSEPWLR